VILWLKKISISYYLGLETLIDKKYIENGKIEICVEGAFYYRVFPAFDKQKELIEKHRREEEARLAAEQSAEGKEESL